MRCAGLSPRNGLGEDRNHGGADMAQVRTWVGLDVHAAKVVAAIADSESGELAAQRMGGATEQVVEFCSGLPAPVRVESSPWEQQVAHLRCLRGIDTLSALGLCAEVGDFERFARPA